MAERSSDAGLTAHFIAEGVVVVVIAIWWFAARGLPAFVLPGPFAVARAFGTMFVDPLLMGHILASFARVLCAVVVSLAVAIPVAALAVWSRDISTIVERNLVVLFNSFPSVGWAILGAIWFSASNFTVIFIETMIVFPFCLINALQGFRQVDRDLEEMGLSLTRSRVRQFFKLTLPMILPFLIAGTRIAYGIAWKIALVAELFGATSGLGWLIQQAQNRADGATILAASFIIIVLFAAADGLVLRPLARRFSIN
jgi:ABC-type nitrate/sulfonate/bicarbonate transport system permease component